MEGFIAGVLMFLGTESFTLNQDVERAQPTWSCGQIVWTQSAAIVDSHFVGAVSAQCQFQAQARTGISDLRNYLVEKTEKSKKVHAGPKAELYQSLDSHYYDVTREEVFGSDTVSVRADVHVASDLSKRLIYDAFSKSVSGTGYAAYLRQFDIKTAVVAAQKQHEYKLAIGIAVKVKKPALVPSSTFRDELKKQIEKMAPEVERSLIEEIQLHI